MIQNKNYIYLFIIMFFKQPSNCLEVNIIKSSTFILELKTLNLRSKTSTKWLVPQAGLGSGKLHYFDFFKIITLTIDNLWVTRAYPMHYNKSIFA